jgi:hypothetical protein
MDFLIKQGLDINGNDSQILRTLAWHLKYDIAIFLVLNRGADIDKAIRDSEEREEWNTTRELRNIKLKVERRKKNI